MSDYLGGVWPTEAAAKAAGVQDVVNRIAPTPGKLAVQAARYTRTYIPPGALGYEWNDVAVLDNHSDDGNNCARYDKAFKYGKGPTWAQCREAQDRYPGTDGGPLYVDELDYMGYPGRRTTGAASLCVIGRSNEGPARDPTDNSIAHLDCWFKLIPNYADWGRVKLDYFIRSYVVCEEAFIAMQGGDTIRFSDDPAVPKLGFDVQTGWLGWWKVIDDKRVLVWGFHALTGDTAKMLPLP